MDPLTVILWSGLGILVAGYIGNKRGEPRGGLVCGLLLGPILGAALIWLGTTERFATPEADAKNPAPKNQPQTQP